MASLKYFIFIGLLLIVVQREVFAAKILSVAFFSTKSHKLTYMPLLEELGKRGHNITIVSPVKSTKQLKNINEIFTFEADKLLGANFDIFDMKARGATLDPNKIFGLAFDSCETSLNLPQVRAILEEKFDLVFLQPLFNDCVLPLIYRLQIPFVMFTPTAVPPLIVSAIGGHIPSSIHPNILLNYPSEMNFYQRFVSLAADIGMSLFWTLSYEPKIEAIYRRKLGDDIPSIQEIMRNASLVLGNSHFSITGPKPDFPDVVDVGGLHSRPGKPIPKDLENFIQTGKDGFILFSMGSAIKGDMMPEEKRKMILNVFSKLKQQVLWKWESESMPDLPKNVKLSKWLPQQDLLAHKDIKMFITHCGGGSTEESIYHGVPLVGIPMMADQPYNAKLARNHGIIIELKWNEMTEKDFEDAINEILNNPVYRQNAKKVSALFQDRPMDPLELGVYWIEYVLRHKGAPHLRNAGRNLNMFQYHSIDVIGVYLTIIFVALYLVYAILRWVCRKVFCRNNKKCTTSSTKKTN